MKKILIAIVTSLLLNSCSSLNKGYSKTFDGTNAAKTYHDENGELNLTGVVNVEDFQQKTFSSWFNKGYNAYKLHGVDAKELKKITSGVTIEVYFGTWCSDSQREIPRFVKAMKELKIDAGKVKYVALNKDRKAFMGEEIGKNINRTPTIIFYKKDATFDRYPSEIGRIVEAPIESLEKDMVKILKNENYVPNYAK